jgi:hypothetical protein
MPQYLLLIYGPAEGGPGPDEQANLFERWNDFTQSLKDAGIYMAGDALQGIDNATTVRQRDGQTQITDGPFAETKEILGGYYLVDAPDLDTVLEHARSTPNIGWGSVEVRPVWDYNARADR